MAKIFISSTYKDLQHCREHVHRVLEKMGHTVVAMEAWVAADERPVNRCLECVASSDIYVGVVAWRYGHIPDESNSDRRSITELELREAERNGKECLLFLLREDAPWPRPQMDLRDSPARIELLREELTRKYMVAFFNDAKELGTEVTLAVSKWQEKQVLVGELHSQFRSEFTVVSSIREPREPVYREATKVFVHEIESLLKMHRRDQKEVNVGIVGGATVSDMVRLLGVQQFTPTTPASPALRFVSLNMAGKSEFAQFSGNYFVVALSELWKGASHFVALPNLPKREQVAYKKYVSRLDLLLCSAGGRDGFLSELRRLHAPKQTLPPDMIGDFCLSPIDAKGRKLECPVAAELNPQPTFRVLGDLRRSGMRIILPIVAQPRYFKAYPDHEQKNQETLKTNIASVVLRSGIVSHCIMDESLAECLR